MAATNQAEAEAEAWEPPQLDEALQNWLFDESRPDLNLGHTNNNALSAILFPTAAQMLPEMPEESPLTSGSGDTGSQINALSGSSATAASSLVPEWPPPEEVSLSEPMALGECTEPEWPLAQPEQPCSDWMPSYQVYQPELSDLSNTPARHNSQASPRASESTSFTFNSAPSSILDSPPVAMMLPSQCRPLMAPCCSGMEPVYHRTANGFEICHNHLSIPLPDVPSTFLTDSCSPPRLYPSPVDETQNERSHNPDVSSPPHKLSAREWRMLTKPEKCPIPGCSKRYPWPRELERHIHAKHKDTVPQKAKIPCPFPGCVKGYARSDHLTRHWKKKHGALEHRRRGLRVGDQAIILPAI